MIKYAVSTLKVIYSFIEEFVYLVAAFSGFIIGMVLNSVIAGIVVFFVICGAYWALPSMLKKFNKTPP